MLWYKSWLETRLRFLISFLGITAICGYSVFHGDRLALHDTGIDYYYSVLHGTHTLLAMMWILAVTLLAMDGLLREKAVGTSSFTLALPVTRARLLGVRIMVVLLQALTLAIIPSSVMFLVGSIAGKTHSIQQAGFHLLLLLGGGLIFLAVAILCSSLVEGQYTAPMVSFGIVIALLVVLNDLREYSPFAFMVGDVYFRRKTSLLEGPLPLLQVAVYGLLSALIVFAAMRVVKNRNF